MVSAQYEAAAAGLSAKVGQGDEVDRGLICPSGRYPWPQGAWASPPTGSFLKIVEEGFSHDFGDGWKKMLEMGIMWCGNSCMRTTVALEDDLLAKASKWTGIDNKSELLNFVLKEFIRREAGRRLAEMGGSMPDIELTPRGERVGRAPLVTYAGKPPAEIQTTKVAEE